MLWATGSDESEAGKEDSDDTDPRGGTPHTRGDVRAHQGCQEAERSQDKA